MRRIAYLTGASASGKTTVARRIAARGGTCIIDGDSLLRSVAGRLSPYSRKEWYHHYIWRQWCDNCDVHLAIRAELNLQGYSSAVWTSRRIFVETSFVAIEGVRDALDQALMEESGAVYRPRLFYLKIDPETLMRQHNSRERNSRRPIDSKKAEDIIRFIESEIDGDHTVTSQADAEELICKHLRR